MHENEISSKIIASSIEIHKKYGPGLLESFYEDCLFNSLINKGLTVERQKRISIDPIGNFKSKSFRIDLLVESKVIIEIKAVSSYANVHSAQVLTYLKITNLKLGLLINFNKARVVDGIKRIVNGL
jgi:GxxExxY protein